MSKVGPVLWNEFMCALRSKAFIAGALAAPLMLLTHGIIQVLSDKQVDTTERKFLVVDRSGDLFPILHEAAEKRKQNSEKQQAHYVAIEYSENGKTFANDDELLLDLSGKVRLGEIFAFIVIEKSIFDEDPPRNALRYFSNSPTQRELPSWIESTVYRDIEKRRIAHSGIDPKLIKTITKRVTAQRMGLSRKDASGKVTKAKKENIVQTIIEPLVALMMMYLILMTIMPILLTTGMEEKVNKISEFLVSAVPPFQLLLGKLLGILLVAVLLASLYIGSIAALTHFAGIEGVFTPLKLISFYLFLVLGGLMIGSVCLAISSVCNELRDSQSFMFPVMMIATLPLMVGKPLLDAPDGWFARIMSMIPPFTPMLMQLRLSLPQGVPWWELALSIVLTTAFAILCVKAASKVYRIGLLAQGQTPSFRQLLKWLSVK